MASLIFNQVYRIRSGPMRGVWRAVCSLPGKGESVLARLPIILDGIDSEPSVIDFGKMRIDLARLSFSQSSLLIECGEMHPIEIDFSLSNDDEISRASDAANKIYKKRVEVMKTFCSPSNLATHFEEHKNFGKMVQAVFGAGTNAQHYGRSSSRRPEHSLVTIYEWLKRLCFYGFNVVSLFPKYSECGARGVQREYKNPKSKPGTKTLDEQLNIEDHPQKAVDLSQRVGIISKFIAFRKSSTNLNEAYSKLVIDMWVRGWRHEEGKLVPILPEKGTYPSKRQILYLYRAFLSEVERLQLGVTPLTFARRYRGLGGFAYDGVAGPGHVYAIDSTRCDTHLRSTVNRHWLVGRPFVYWLVDVWSTAIVGFYVCLDYPSWQSARVALFCSVYDSDVLSNIWGFSMDLGLDPHPTLPRSFLCDRGEYLSEGAKITAEELSFDLSYNPAYRADLKGSVEVFNRIQKDDAHGLIPGTIDARRLAYEQRPNPRSSAMNLRELARYAAILAKYKNLRADRTHRLTDEMRASRVPSTPAGIHNFGYKIGIGYEAPKVPDRLVTKLLNPLDMVVNRSGLKYGSLYYRSDEIDVNKWSAHARNFGAYPINGFVIPSAPQSVWATLPGDEARRFILAPNAPMPIESSLIEHADVLCYAKLNKMNREHERVSAEVAYLKEKMELASQSRAALKAEPLPPFDLGLREARALEMSNHPERDRAEDTRSSEIYEAISEGSSHREANQKLITKILSSE